MPMLWMVNCIMGRYSVETLTNLSKKIDTTKMLAPSFLMVLTGIGDYAYRRNDGVYVVPIGCLRA